MMKVLLAVDGSPCSAAAVDAVIERCWPEGTHFKVVCVLEPIYSQCVYTEAYALIDTMATVERQLADHCQRIVDESVAKLRDTFGHGRVEGQMLQGPVADAILQESKEWLADLIVVGSHGRRGFERFFIGSVAEKVARKSICSVEIVKAKTKPEKQMGAAQVAHTNKPVQSSVR